MGQAFTWLDPGLNLLRDRDSAAVLQWMREFADSHETELTAATSDQKHPDGRNPMNVGAADRWCGWLGSNGGVHRLPPHRQ